MNQETQILVLNPHWAQTTMATVKHLPSRPSTSSGPLWRRRNLNNNSNNNNNNDTVNRQTILTSRLCRQERLESLTLRRSNTTMLPRVTGIQRPSLTSTGNTTSNTTANSGSSGKKSGSACDSERHSVVATAVGPQSVDSAEADSNVVSEEELERRKNVEKCLTWLHALPAKFSSMHIVQQTVFADES